MPSRPTVLPVVIGAVLALALLAPVTAAQARPQDGPAAASRAAVARPVTGADRVVPDRTDRVLTEDTVAPRSGYVRKWPGNKIRYWAKVPNSFDWSLNAAIRAWNQTGLDMTFVRSSRSRAQTKITVQDIGFTGGLATVGYQGNNWVHLSPDLLEPYAGESDPHTRVVAAHIIAHELGHNLGLGHTSGCDLMTPVLQLPDCDMMADKPGYYRCRVVDSDALRRTVRLYGGKRALAPASCVVDKLPPSLDGVGFHGGLLAESPVELSWQPPSRAPAGSRVQVLIASGATCSFPIVEDYWGEAVYNPNKVDVRRFDPANGGWSPPADGIRKHCYGVQLVNRSGAGRAVDDQSMQSWVPAPSVPSVTEVRRFYGDYAPGQFKAVLTWADPDDSVAVIASPAGQCPDAWPAAEDYGDHYVYAEPGVPFEVDARDANYDPILAPCLAFFTVRSDEARVSAPVVWDVGQHAEPAPAAPVANTVTRAYGDLYDVDVTYDPDVAGLVAAVGPQGSCPAAIPGGDPTPYLIDYGQVDATGTTLPCISFWTVNAVGEVSATHDEFQVVPAPTPPTPGISNLVIDQYGNVSGRTTIDPDVFGLAMVEGPQGACATSIPAGEDPSWYAVYAYDDGAGHVVFDAYATPPHPCVTFFAYNTDGVVSAGVQRQL